MREQSETEVPKISCACTSKALKSMAGLWPNTAKRRSGDPCASGTVLRASILGFMVTKFNPFGEGRTNGDFMARDSVGENRDLRELLGRKLGQKVKFIASG